MPPRNPPARRRRFTTRRAGAGPIDARSASRKAGRGRGGRRRKLEPPLGAVLLAGEAKLLLRAGIRAHAAINEAVGLARRPAGAGPAAWRTRSCERSRLCEPVRARGPCPART